MCAVVEEVGGLSGTLSGGNWIVEHFVNCGLGIDWRFNAGLLRVWLVVGPGPGWVVSLRGGAE